MFVLNSPTVLWVIAIVLIGGFAAQDKAVADEIDLTRAVVVVPDGLSGPEEKAVHLLVEEVQARSRIAWDVMIRWPSGAVPVIAVGPARLLGRSRIGTDLSSRRRRPQQRRRAIASHDRRGAGRRQ